MTIMLIPVDAHIAAATARKWNSNCKQGASGSVCRTHLQVQNLGVRELAATMCLLLLFHALAKEPATNPHLRVGKVKTYNPSPEALTLPWDQEKVQPFSAAN